MENKNKYLFLIVGIVIGVVITLSVAFLFGNDADGGEIVVAETEQGHENAKAKIEVDKAHENEEEIVKLTDDEIKELGIVLNEVGPQKLQQHTDLTGEIVSDPDKLAHIVPRFAGIVKKVNKKIGDSVQKDEIIAVIESNESLVTYDVTSSIDGIVLELHMTPGELIGDGSHVVTIADLSIVWAELNVYQKDLSKIKVGPKAKVYFDELNNSVEGKIFYLSPTVDEHTRTATARVRLNNSQGNWKPGMFVSARVFTEFINVEQAVTLNSIQNFEGKKVVFVKDNDGFEPRPVTIGKTNTKYAEVLSGLQNGDIYIAQGAFVIKSELLKESFGGGHGH